MSKIYGYCRISSYKQNIERQERNILREYPNAIIVREVFTGRNIPQRKELLKLLRIVKAGDMIVFDTVSRMSRDAEEGFALYEELYGKGVELVFLKEHHIDTATYRQELQKQLEVPVSSGDAAADELMQGIIASLNRYIMNLAQRQIQLAFQQSQKEIDDLRQRTREGIETARRNGKQIGQKTGRTLHVKKKAPIQKLILEYSRTFGGPFRDNQVINIINSSGNFRISRNIYYKYKGELKATDDIEDGT